MEDAAKIMVRIKSEKNSELASRTMHKPVWSNLKFGRRYPRPDNIKQRQTSPLHPETTKTDSDTPRTQAHSYVCFRAISRDQITSFSEQISIYGNLQQPEKLY